MWILDSEPSSENASVTSSSDNDSLALQARGISLELIHQGNVVSKDIWDGQILDICLAQRLISEGLRRSIVSVFSKHDQSSKFLSKSLGHETAVVIERPDAAFVSGVEDDWASCVLVVS